MPSEIFPSLGISSLLFNIWTPSTEDEPILEQRASCNLSSGSSNTSPPTSVLLSRSSSTSSRSRSSSPSSSVSSTASRLFIWESDASDWGVFRTWSPVPSPDEAEILLEQQKIEEEEIHARAAQKRAAKKANYFARCKYFAQMRV